MKIISIRWEYFIPYNSMQTNRQINAIVKKKYNGELKI